MLYLFYGSDSDKIREKLGDVVQKLIAKRPDASVFSFTDETYDPAQCEELIGAQTLFAGKSIVVGKALLDNPLAYEFIIKHLKEIAESDNIFLLEEGELKKDIVTKIEKKAAKVQEFSLPKAQAGKGGEFNVFALTDAFGVRDKRGLWVMYHRALDADMAPEELFWKFTWQIKNMLLALRGSKTPTPESLKMNPFVFKKALSAARNFSEDELITFDRDLVVLYHNARRGIGEMGIGLEQFILSL